MSKHLAKVIGGIGHKEYYFDNFYEIYGVRPAIYPKDVLDKKEILFEGELDSPILQPEQKLYISELDLLIKIDEVIRSTDGIYIYKTNNIDIVKDNELTVSTKIIAEKGLEEYNQQRELKKEKEEIQSMVKQSFWKRLFK
jgi:hypothetical protein